MTTYQLHSEPQGTPSWLAGRNTRLNASELVLAAGQSMNGRTRTDLIRKLATGIEPEVDEHTQKRFSKGHRFEALARPIMEQIIGRDLYPITASIEVDGLTRRLGASLDGATDDDSENVEHKSMNAALRDALAQGIIPTEYHWQMEQGQMVNGATRTLFMATEWDDDDNLIEEMHVWYESNPELRAKIIPIWKQAEADAANYQPQEYIPAAAAAPIKDLPAVMFTVSGELAIKTNFGAWGIELRNFIALIPEKPATDQEFADCKAAVAAFKKAEAQLDAEESRVLSLVQDIDEMKREKKLLRDLSSTTRLALEKLVTARDLTLKAEIMQVGKDELYAHIASLNNRLGKPYMPDIPADWPNALKGKKLYSAMRDAVADLVAAKKIESSAIADRIDFNLKLLREEADGCQALFPDTTQIVLKAPDDVLATIKSRIADHKAAEDKRIEAERQKIRAEEEAKAKAAQDALLAAERAKMEADVRAKAEQDAARIAVVKEPERTDALDRAVEKEQAEAAAIEERRKQAQIADQIKPVRLSGLKTAVAQSITPRRPNRAELLDAVATTFGTTNDAALDWILQEFRGDIQHEERKAA